MKIRKFAVSALLAASLCTAFAQIIPPTCDPDDTSCNDPDHGCSGGPCKFAPAPINPLEVTAVYHWQRSHGIK